MKSNEKCGAETVRSLSTAERTTERRKLIGLGAAALGVAAFALPKSGNAAGPGGGLVGGIVDSRGRILEGGGFVAKRLAVGHYELRFRSDLSPVVVLTPQGHATDHNASCTIIHTGPGNVQLLTSCDGSGRQDRRKDLGFSFIALT